MAALMSRLPLLPTLPPLDLGLAHKALHGLDLVSEKPHSLDLV